MLKNDKHVYSFIPESRNIIHVYHLCATFRKFDTKGFFCLKLFHTWSFFLIGITAVFSFCEICCDIQFGFFLLYVEGSSPFWSHQRPDDEPILSPRDYVAKCRFDPIKTFLFAAERADCWVEKVSAKAGNSQLETKTASLVAVAFTELDGAKTAA